MNDNIHTMIGKELVLLRIEKGYSIENIVDVTNLNKEDSNRYEKDSRVMLRGHKNDGSTCHGCGFVFYPEYNSRGKEDF